MPWTMWDAPSDRDYYDQQAPAEPEGPQDEPDAEWWDEEANSPDAHAVWARRFNAVLAAFAAAVVWMIWRTMEGR